MKGLSELFSGCNNLKYINLGNIKLIKLVEYEKIFNGLPENVNLIIDYKLYEIIKNQIHYNWNVSKI